MLRNCKICRKEYVTYPYFIKRGIGLFCSHKCHNLSKPKLVKVCKQCKKTFLKPLCRKKIQYCSGKCAGKGRTGKPNKGRGKKRPQFKGSNNHKWMGDNVGYVALHTWVTREKGKARIHPCTVKDASCKGRMEWSNISRKYKRDLTDWRPLCCSHHKRLDYKLKNYV